MDLVGAVSWNAIIAITGVVVLVPAFSGWVASRVTRWRAKHASGEDNSDRLWTAVFGRPEKPPYPAITGLVTDHAHDHEVLYGKPGDPNHPGLVHGHQDHERRLRFLEARIGVGDHG